MPERELTADRVKRIFVIANRLKVAGDHLTNREAFERRAIEVSRTVDDLSHAAVDREILDRSRLRRIEAARWSRDEIPLDRCWVWPQADRRPWARGTVEVVATKISAVDPDNKARKIEPLVDVIVAHVPPIVFAVPPGIQAGDYADQAGWLVGAYDLDDGNHRALAAYLAGRRSIVALVGRLGNSP